jgi:3-oxoacyl-[acyl-carrier protein] reductase
VIFSKAHPIYFAKVKRYMLQGKTALITGGSRGIGRAIALLFAQHGCDVAFTYSRSEQMAKELVQTIAGIGGKALAIQSDAANFDAAGQVVQQVVDAWGKIDILVCNAGITRDNLILRMNEQQWDEVMDTNLKSVFNYCHAVAPVMMRQRKGSIIAMSSVVGIAGNAGQTNYAASKAGVIALIKSLAKELGARNIRANAIAPGMILTDMTAVLPDGIKEQVKSSIPLRRFGEAEEVAQVALFLASDMASYVTGEVLSVDGGM